MIDVNYIRENPDKVKEIVRKRGKPEKANIDRWLELDVERKKLLTTQGTLNSERNALAAQGQKGDIAEIKEKAIALKEELKKVDTRLQEVTAQWQEILDWVPNIPLEGMPEGKGEPDNIILKAWVPGTGYIAEAVGVKARGFTEKFMPNFPIHADNTNFEPKHPADLGKNLGFIDIEQGTKVAGSRFTYLVGDLVLMQYALQRLVMEYLFEHGFTPIVPPLLVKERVVYGSSHLPEGKDQIYTIKDDNVEENQQLFLLGSTEPANFAYCMDKVLDPATLPLKLVAYAPAFRSEAGSWGKDAKGIKRMHQFDKIEMDVICTPEQSDAIFEELLGINEWLMQTLELPYQLAQKCTGDAGYYASAKQVDPEVWLPVQKEFMEVGTDTNATDFQARRMNIKYQTADGNKEYVHTVNDTGVAMGRMLTAILENYQQSDGRILVPEKLQKYMGKTIIG